MNTYPLTLLYDESCPMCRLEIDNLKARNDKQLLQFVDASAPDFDASPYGIPQEELMRVIYAVKPDGSTVTGVEVLRLAYGAVGLGWLAAPTGWPVLKPVFDRLYLGVAGNRYRLSRLLGPLIIQVRAHRVAQKMRECKNGNCSSGVAQ